jgi:hypothetical protein
MLKDQFTDLMAQHATVNKNLHWSIKPIGGPDEYKLWKQEQSRKHQADYEAFQAKRSMVITGMEDGSLVSKDFKVSDTTKIHEKFKENKRILDERFAASRLRKQNTMHMPKQSMISRIYDWFINVKFEI